MSHPSITAPDGASDLSAWLGHSASSSAQLSAAPATALAATLDRDPPATNMLPALGHWLYFLPDSRQSEIGADGHPQRGGFLPPIALPRRMWAGGRLSWQPDNPLHTGETVEKTSTISAIHHKAGRSGELVFVTVRHTLANARGLAITEEQDIVYRAAALPGAAEPAPEPAERGAAWRRELQADPVLLFRYSALTFNAHRIHYDRDYATRAEGYPGLVVHGPLLATLLVDLLQRKLPDARLAGFEFRAVRPTFDIHPFALNGQPSADGRNVRLWAEDHQGFLTMQATATLA